MTFTMCGVIVGSCILVVTQHACHAFGSGSEFLMRTHSMHAKACVHVVNMLSQHINKVEWPPCRKTSKKCCNSRKKPSQRNP